MDMPPSAGGKPVASLKPALLARKGGARPAMRSQLEAALVPADPEDLGWNDMGDETAAMPGPANVPAIGHIVDFPRAVPRPRRARNPRGSALEAGRKAAFTLRLDAERHLKLRLACTLDSVSAQAVVTAALDRLLADMPEIEALADQVAGQIAERAARRRQS